MLARDEHVSRVATPNHDLWRVRNITYNSPILALVYSLTAHRREGLTPGRTLEKVVMWLVCGVLRTRLQSLQRQ